MANTTVQSVESQTAFNDAISSTPSSALAVIYFHAPWAAPCAQMSTVLDTLASTYPKSDPPKVVFLSINAEELPDVSEEYDVTAVPYIVLARDGKVLDSISGSDAAKVRAAVEKHAGVGSSKGNAAELPPAQQVTRPEQQPALGTGSAPDTVAPAINSTTTNGTNGHSSTSATKNLSAYAPDAKDPQTSAEYSSKTQPGLGAKSSNDGSASTDLTTRLQQLTNAAPCMLFMKGTPSAPQCGFSRQLVSILRQSNVRYGFFNILADEEIRQGLKEYADWPTFPQLWLGGELVGGLDIVKEEMEGNPEFFAEYAVETKKKDMGGPSSAEMKDHPQAAA